MSELAPVPPRERLLSLDVLRGFALCGVMIGNMVLLSGTWARLQPDSAPGTVDEVASWFKALVVESKAQTLLTWLFGFGFAAQLLRAQARGEPVMGHYVRRLLALFVFGFLHVTLLWWGDVTWTYAVSGFGLLAFVHASNRTRLWAGLALIFVPLLVMRIFPEVQGAIADATVGHGGMRAGTARMRDALVHADKLSLTWEHLRYVFVWCSFLWGWYFFWTLGRFLLGYIAGQARWFDDDGAGHLPVFRRLALWGGAVGALTTTVEVLERLAVIDLRAQGTGGEVAAMFSSEIGLLAMTSFYVGVVVLLLQHRPWRRVLGVLAPAGRMPLTVYVTQSLVATFLFYGWGLGLAGRFHTAALLGISVAIFTVEVVLCHLWLRSFRFGPLEWLWRWAVYLHRPPMRRAPVGGSTAGARAA